MELQSGGLNEKQSQEGALDIPSAEVEPPRYHIHHTGTSGILACVTSAAVHLVSQVYLLNPIFVLNE